MSTNSTTIPLGADVKAHGEGELFSRVTGVGCMAHFTCDGGGVTPLSRAIFSIDPMRQASVKARDAKKWPTDGGFNPQRPPQGQRVWRGGGHAAGRCRTSPHPSPVFTDPLANPTSQAAALVGSFIRRIGGAFPSIDARSHCESSSETWSNLPVGTPTSEPANHRMPPVMTQASPHQCCLPATLVARTAPVANHRRLALPASNRSSRKKVV